MLEYSLDVNCIDVPCTKAVTSMTVEGIVEHVIKINFGNGVRVVLGSSSFNSRCFSTLKSIGKEESIATGPAGKYARYFGLSCLLLIT